MKAAREVAPSNAHIAELLALEAGRAQPPMNRAFRRAARKAHLWPDEASDLLGQDQSLTTLDGVGPYIEKFVRRWIESPPEIADPPPVRAGFLTFTEAQQTLERNSKWLAGVRGDLQMHTQWSDGSASVQEMADAAAERNYEFIAITDHTKGLKIAGGINEEKLDQQAEEIRGVNKMLGKRGARLRVLRSAELNIDPSGAGDMEPAALEKLDVVLGCFHSSLRKTEEQTRRYLAALKNPSIQILGHPRGRIYNYRLGLTADWSKVFALAAKLDKAVEIDGYPDRQDLSPDLLKVAKKEGCRISFGTDSHGPSQLRFMVFSAASALTAGIKADRILNFLSVDALLEWSRNVRDSQRKPKKYARTSSTR
jgi:histidinol phosphatase-like PHP family hydrolase